MNVRDRITAELDAGASLRTVARRLNLDGIPTPSGRGEWHPETVARQTEPYRTRYVEYMREMRRAHRWGRGDW